MLQTSQEVKSPISPHLEAQPSESGGQRVVIKSGRFPNKFPRWSGGAAWGFAMPESSKHSRNCHHPSATNHTDVQHQQKKRKIDTSK